MGGGEWRISAQAEDQSGRLGERWSGVDLVPFAIDQLRPRSVGRWVTLLELPHKCLHLLRLPNHDDRPTALNRVPSLVSM